MPDRPSLCSSCGHLAGSHRVGRFDPAGRADPEKGRIRRRCSVDGCRCGAPQEKTEKDDAVERLARWLHAADPHKPLGPELVYDEQHNEHDLRFDAPMWDELSEKGRAPYLRQAADSMRQTDAARRGTIEETLAAVVRTVEAWDAKVSNTQQDDMPGFVREYTPSLLADIAALRAALA